MISNYVVLYPLFGFDYTGDVDIDRMFFEEYDLQNIPENFIFQNENFALKSFNLDTDYPNDDIDFFSPFEKEQMKQCRWCISVGKTFTTTLTIQGTYHYYSLHSAYILIQTVLLNIKSVFHILIRK